MADAHAHISLMSFSAPGDGRPVFPGTQFGVHLAVRRARGETGRVRPRRGAERHDRRTPWKNNSRNFAAAAPPGGRRPQRDSDRCRKRYCTTHDDVTPLSEQLEKLERGQTDRVINNTID